MGGYHRIPISTHETPDCTARLPQQPEAERQSSKRTSHLPLLILAVMVALMVHRSRSLLSTSAALLMAATRGTAFSPGVGALRTAISAGRPCAAAAAAAAPSATHALQQIWDELSAGAELREVEARMMEVETELFSQASAWSKTFTPLRTVVAEVAGSMSVSVLVLPRELYMS